MRQLVLDIRLDAPLNFENFVTGANPELVSRLKLLARPEACEVIYVWGEPGCGRTHLLRATASLAQSEGRIVHFVPGKEVDDDLTLPPAGLLVIDDIDALSPIAQIAVFRAYNNVRTTGCGLLLSGNAPPLGLTLREDLRTRVGQALCYHVLPLSEEDRARTLMQQAATRGLPLTRDVVDYLLRHSPRDLPSLLAMLDKIDHATLEQKRPITLPLVRDLMNAPTP